MYLLVGKAVFNADDEEPKCAECDCMGAFEQFCKECGPEHCWCHYQRTIDVKDLVNYIGKKLNKKK